MNTISVTSQIAILVLLGLYAFLLFRTKLNGKVLKRSALVIFCAGIVLYMYAFMLEPYNQGVVTCLLRSVVNSAKMFIYDDNLIEIEEAQFQPFFLEIFILVFYAAILTSVSAIIMLFGKRVFTFFTLALRKTPFKHIFIGINPRTEIIAKGLNPKEIAVIEFPGESGEDQMSLSAVLKSITNSDSSKSLKFLRGISVLRANHKLSATESGRNVLDSIGLKKLRNLISSETSFYILGEDPDKNLSQLLALMDDPQLRNNTVHACMRREGLSKPYRLLLAKTGAHFIYPSSLSVVELMKDVAAQPASVMSANGDGTVNGHFNALIVGFGETGQAVAKFIYEFSSAVRPDGSVLPVRITACDAYMDRLKGHFIFDSPEMNNADIIDFKDFGQDSGKFWDLLLEKLDVLNYIEISMKDDSANLELACVIYGYVQKKRHNGFENFKILVRKKSTPDYEQKLIDRLNEKAGCEVIKCFGEFENVFKTEMIVSSDNNGINDQAMALAHKIEANYKTLTGMDAPSCVDASSYAETQHKRIENHQNISRANHIPSKLVFTGGAREVSGDVLENLARVEHLRYCRYLLAHGYTYDPLDDDVFKTNHNLCDWSLLPEEDKEYHRCMAQASLK